MGINLGGFPFVVLKIKMPFHLAVIEILFSVLNLDVFFELNHLSRSARKN